MFTKSEIKALGKGFTPSRSGQLSSNSRGTETGNRKYRRSELSRQKGDHRNRPGILRVDGVIKFRSRIQIIDPVFDAKVEGKGKKAKLVPVIIPGKKILHWDIVK